MTLRRGSAIRRTRSGRIELVHPHLTADLNRLDAAMQSPPAELVLVSRRQLRSMNSWMHNVTSLVRGKERCTLQIHSLDAARLGIGADDHVSVSSAGGTLVAPAEVTDDLRPGVVCLPHGWGHDVPGSVLGVARSHPGVNINELSPAAMIDVASGNAVVNGIPVSLIKVGDVRSVDKHSAISE